MFLHCCFLVFVAYTLDFIRLTWQAIRVFTTQDKIKLFEHVKLFSAFVNWKEFSRNGNKIDKFLATKKRFLAKYFYFKTCHVILRSLSCMYTASCTRNLQDWKFYWVSVRDAAQFFGGKSLKNSSVQFFAKNVARGNSVQNGPNFPAKSLSIYTKSFSGHYLIESQLNIWVE